MELFAGVWHDFGNPDTDEIKVKSMKLTPEHHLVFTDIKNDSWSMDYPEILHFNGVYSKLDEEGNIVWKNNKKSYFYVETIYTRDLRRVVTLYNRLSDLDKKIKQALKEERKNIKRRKDKHVII